MDNIKSYAIDSLWYSWVPTNLGSLNFDYIGDTSSLKTIFGCSIRKEVFGCDDYIVDIEKPDEKRIIIKNTNLSDLNYINSWWKNIEEANDEALIYIKRCDSCFQGNIEIKYDEYVKISSKFKVDVTGKTSIYDAIINFDETKVKSIVYSDILDETIITAIYTILKKVIHGDNHHEQKIDTFVGVYKNAFNPIAILDSFAISIKSRERVIKDGSRNNCYYKQQKILSGIETNGYVSYIKTFKELFCDDSNKVEFDKKINYIGNVVESLKASLEKIKFDLELKQKHITLIMTFIAFVVSLNILYNGMHTNTHVLKEAQEAILTHKINYIVSSIFAVLFIYLLTIKNLCFSRFFSKIEVFWEYVRYMALDKKRMKVGIFIFIGSTINAFLGLIILKKILLFTANLLLQ